MKNKIQEIWWRCRPTFEKVKETLKENKIIVAIVLISLLSIYFFGIRPSQIRKQCSTHAFYIVSGKGQFSGDIRRVSDDQYKNCLRQNGIGN